MKEHFVFFDQKEFESQLEANGKILALANPNEVYWGPGNVFHEQIARSLGKDPRLDENTEWFEQFARLFFDLENKEVSWTFELVPSENIHQHKRKVRQHYDLGFNALKVIQEKYPSLKDLRLKIDDSEKMLEKFSCVSTFKEIDGKWELVEMSISEQKNGLTLKEAKSKYNPYKV